jgi:hypothetical protein
VRAGADLAVIAEQRGRTRGAVVSRLLRMIPVREDIPEEEQFGWIMARLADPCFDCGCLGCCSRFLKCRNVSPDGRYAPRGTGPEDGTMS